MEYVLCVCVLHVHEYVLLRLAGNTLDDSGLCGVQVRGCTAGIEERTFGPVYAPRLCYA